MDIPFYILLIAYLIPVGFFMLWAFFNFYHLIKFGFFDFTGKLNAFLFVGFSLVTIGITILLLKDTPWFDTVSTTDIFPQGGIQFNSQDNFGL